MAWVTAVEHLPAAAAEIAGRKPTSFSHPASRSRGGEAGRPGHAHRYGRLRSPRPADRQPVRSGGSATGLSCVSSELAGKRSKC